MSDAVNTQAQPEAKPQEQGTGTVEAAAAQQPQKQTLLSEGAADSSPKAEPPVQAQQSEVKYDLKLPEGSSLGKEHVDSVLALAKAKGLSPEQAQLVLEQKSEAVASFAKLQQEQADAQATQWYESLKKDPAFGGENFTKNATMVASYMRKAFSPEVLDFLDKSGLANHPAIVKDILKLAQAGASDTFVHAKQTQQERKPTWAKMYGETTPGEPS
jgi:hypothetical protein